MRSKARPMWLFCANISIHQGIQQTMDGDSAIVLAEQAISTI